jgi:hypothetical protein
MLGTKGARVARPEPATQPPAPDPPRPPGRRPRSQPQQPQAQGAMSQDASSSASTPSARRPIRCAIEPPPPGALCGPTPRRTTRGSSSTRFVDSRGLLASRYFPCSSEGRRSLGVSVRVAASARAAADQGAGVRTVDVTVRAPRGGPGDRSGVQHFPRAATRQQLRPSSRSAPTKRAEGRRSLIA